jgi:hypothetical protein
VGWGFLGSPRIWQVIDQGSVGELADQGRKDYNLLFSEHGLEGAILNVVQVRVELANQGRGHLLRCGEHLHPSLLGENLHHSWSKLHEVVKFNPSL